MKASTAPGAYLEVNPLYSSTKGLQEPLYQLDIAAIDMYPPWHIYGGHFGVKRSKIQVDMKVTTVAGTGNRHNSQYTTMVDLQMDLKWSQSLDLMSGQVGHIPNEFRKPARAIYKSIIWELQKPLVQIS